MANNEIKTNAEIYREQRKARLAKAAKKKKSGKGDKIVGIIVKVICIVLVATVVLYGAAKMLTDVFCVPQKVLTAATYEDEKLSVAEYNYYYMSLFNRAVSISQQYDAQYQGYGSSYFNTSVDPAEQDYPGEDAPEGVKTWADYFKHTASTVGLTYKALYKEATSEEAKKNGFELTEEQKTEMQKSIDEALKTLTENAERDDFSLDNYIAKVCGEGLNEKSYRELLERDSVVAYYQEWYQENAKTSITKEDVDKYYADNRADIDIASIRYFTVSYAEATEGSTDPVYTKDQAKARANQFVAKVTDEASFIAAVKEFAPASLKSSYADESVTLGENLTKPNIATLSEAFANWMFDAKRTAGEISVFDVEEQKTYYIAYIVTPAHKDTQVASADVRHILVQAETTDADGKKLSDAEVAKNFATAKTEADKILAEWKAGEATEDSFAKLATAKTDDAGSKETGGLYEDIKNDGKYVPEFTEWALASHKVGDTGIIKTDYGYHIMYFVGADNMQKWESDVRSTIASEDFETHFNGITDAITEKTERNDVIVDFFAKRTAKVVSRYTTSSTTATY